jgi:hypothetical protein
MRITGYPDKAISEIISIILILSLVVVLTMLSGVFLFGMVKPVAKTGYLVPSAAIINPGGVDTVWLQDRGGDTFSLNQTPKTSYYNLGITIEANNTVSRAGLAPSLKGTIFAPGNQVFIYTSGTGYLVTDNITAIPASGSIPSGPVTLVLTDETSHELIARIILRTSSVTSTPTPTPTATPVPISSILVNAVKPGSLQSGGVLQFQVTGLWSWVNVDGTVYNENPGDSVKLVTGSDGSGKIYATSTEIDTFSFDDVSLYINGVYKARGTINGIYINGYSGETSSLTLKVPAASGWTNVVVDGTTLLNGPDSSPITVSGLKGTMNMDSTGSIYYLGSASGYSLA